ncbi:MAG: DUF4105 domain-containing protein [Myxococcales bacterium]|nr:DUF4105 domain-containing protein [Myxococcales bacterium]
MTRLRCLPPSGRLWYAAALALGFAIATATTALGQPRQLRAADYNGQIPPSAEPPRVDLYTFERGPVIFEKYGHAALCLHYEHAPGDVCLNYGVTDFANAKGLVWGFLRGTTKFWVEPAALEETLRFYTWEDRTIWRQILPTTPAQARALEAKLWGDLHESRRYYEYDHFFDNCTTRLRDMIDDTFAGALRADAAKPDPADLRTFRELGYSGLAEFPPLLAISDFAVGRDIDVPPTLYEKMFLPDEVRINVATRLGVVPELIYQRRGPPFPSEGSKGREVVALIGLGAAALIALALWRRRLTRTALAIAMVPTLFMGLVIWTLVAISAIPSLRINEVALMYWPIDVAILFLAWPRKQLYARIKVGVLAAVAWLAVVGVLRQPVGANGHDWSAFSGARADGASRRCQRRSSGQSAATQASQRRDRARRREALGPRLPTIGGSTGHHGAAIARKFVYLRPLDIGLLFA